MDDDTDEDDSGNGKKNSECLLHLNLATPSTVLVRNIVSAKVRKSALAQQQQRANGTYRGKSNSRGCDGATATNDEDDEEKHAAAVDTLRQQRRVKPHTRNLHTTCGCRAIKLIQYPAVGFELSVWSH